MGNSGAELGRWCGKSACCENMVDALIEIQSIRGYKSYVTIEAIYWNIVIISVVRIGYRFRDRKIKDGLLRKSGHRLSDSGSTRNFKYWEAISLGVRLNGG